MANVIEYNGSDKWKQKATELLNRGGGGGTDDYEELNNLPQINGTTLIGDLSLNDLFYDWYNIGSDYFLLADGDTSQATDQNPVYEVGFTSDDKARLVFYKDLSGGYGEFEYLDFERLHDLLQLSNNYNDLINKPSVNGYLMQGNVTLPYSSFSDKPSINGVTLSGALSLSDLGIPETYNDLNNKPSINNVTLSGNKTLADLGIVEFADTYSITSNSFTLYSGDLDDATAQNPIYSIGFDATSDASLIFSKYEDPTSGSSVWLTMDDVVKLRRWYEYCENGWDIYPEMWSGAQPTDAETDILLEAPIDETDPTQGVHQMRYGTEGIKYSTRVGGAITNVFSIGRSEIQALENVTGNIQTQLDGKASTSHTHSTYVEKAGDTMTGRLTADGNISVKTSGGTFISQKDTDKASIKVTTKAVTDGSRYDSIIGGMSTDDSSWNMGIIDNKIYFGRYASNQTANEFTESVYIDLINGYVSKANTANSATTAGSCTGNAATATVANSVSRATFGDKSNGEHNANNIASNGLYYYTSNGPATSLGMSTSDAALYCQAYNTTWVAQIAQDYRNGTLCVRGKNSGTWSAWKRILDSTQYDTAATANKLAMRTNSGYLNAVYFNMTNASQQNPSSYTSYAAFVSSDGYLRQSTLANFKNWLGIREGTTYAGHIVTWNSGILCTSGISVSTISEKVGSYASGTSWVKINWLLQFYNSTNMLIQNSSGSNYIWATSSWSDARIKKNIKDTDVVGLEKINAIKLRQFDFKDEARGTHKEIGYVAQELQEVVSDCVMNVPDKEFEDGLLYVEDKPLIPYLVKAVQELSAKVESLENKLKQMEELRNGKNN